MQIGLELLAPAKNKDIGIAAIDCGADAVYIAGPKFGAREAAGNSFSDITELVHYAHRFGVRIYLTLNTILYENELEEANRMIREAYRAGCDAVIVQDLSVFKMELPSIPLYASTQTVIRTPREAAFAQSLGFERLILERGLSIEQIRSIRQAVEVPLEAFVHGALCVCYSGQCYLSQYLTGRSANRGTCTQACRSDYTLTDSGGWVIESGRPLLSPKDLNLENRIPDLIRTGVTSFKIEGRLKNISYVKNIVSHYSLILDTWIREHPQYTRSSWGECTRGFTPRPWLTFNRGYTEFFIDGKRSSWRSADGAKYLGEFLGYISRVSYNRQGMLEFRYEYPSGGNNGEPSRRPGEIRNGDGLCFVTPEGEILGARANTCHENLVCTTEKIRIPVNTKIYRNYNIAFEKELESRTPRRLIPVPVRFIQGPDGYSIRAQLPPLVPDIASRENIFPVSSPDEERQTDGLPEAFSIHYKITDESSPARNPETAREAIASQLSKTAGIFRFEVKEIQCETIPFFPTAVLNGFRRALAEEAEKKLEMLRKAARLREEKATERLRQAVRTSTGPDAPDRTSGQAPRDLTYLANCSNSLSGEVYKERGALRIAPAYELRPPEKAELMRTKYCIKYELGLCARYGDPHKAGSLREPLFLLNGKNRLELKFDCRNCEMIIIG